MTSTATPGSVQCLRYVCAHKSQSRSEVLIFNQKVFFIILHLYASSLTPRDYDHQHNDAQGPQEWHENQRPEFTEGSSQKKWRCLTDDSWDHRIDLGKSPVAVFAPEVIGIPYPACRTAKTSSERPEVYGNYTSVVRCSQCRVLMSAVQLQNSKDGRPAHAANITGIISTSGRSGDCAPSIQAVTCCYMLLPQCCAAVKAQLVSPGATRVAARGRADSIDSTWSWISKRNSREFRKERFRKVLEGPRRFQHVATSDLLPSFSILIILAFLNGQERSVRIEVVTCCHTVNTPWVPESLSPCLFTGRESILATSSKLLFSTISSLWATWQIWIDLSDRDLGSNRIQQDPTEMTKWSTPSTYGVLKKSTQRTKKPETSETFCGFVWASLLAPDLLFRGCVWSW